MNKSNRFAEAMGKIDDSYVTGAMSYGDPYKRSRVFAAVAASVVAAAAVMPLFILAALKYFRAPDLPPASSDTAATEIAATDTAAAENVTDLEFDTSVPPDTELDLWILRDVSDLDLSGYPVLWDSGIAGEYYGKGYDLKLDEYGHFVSDSVKQNVTYYLSPWPDISDEGKYVTKIVITDPNVKVFGFTLSYMNAYFERNLKLNGYTIDAYYTGPGPDCRVIAHKGGIHVSVERRDGSGTICIRVDVTNKNDLDLYYKYSPDVNAPAPPDTDLDLWILTDVRHQDWSDYNEIYGWFGCREFFGKGYDYAKDENGYNTDPDRYVKYRVSSWPDAISGNSYVTLIEITDPSVRVFGLTCESSKEQFDAILTQHGFSSGEYEGYTGYSTEVITWKGESYNISVLIDNVSGVRRLAIAAPTTNNFDIVY